MRGNLPTPEPMPPSPAAIDDAILVAQLKRDSANLACGKDFELWALLPRKEELEKLSYVTLYRLC